MGCKVCRIDATESSIMIDLANPRLPDQPAVCSGRPIGARPQRKYREGVAMKREELTLTPELASFVESFSQLAVSLPQQMATLCAEIEKTEARMQALARQGVIRAIPRWRTGGQGAYLALVFPADADGKCASKFVGRNPVKIQEALVALNRAVEYDHLQGLLYRMMEKSLDASKRLLQLRDALMC